MSELTVHINHDVTLVGTEDEIMAAYNKILAAIKTIEEVSACDADG